LAHNNRWRQQGFLIRGVSFWAQLREPAAALCPE
jgi:hypothetical protein